MQGEPIDWDDVLAAGMIAAGARASSATRAATGLPGAGPKPGAEPYVDLVAKTQRDVQLKVRQQCVHATLAWNHCFAASMAINTMTWGSKERLLLVAKCITWVHGSWHSHCLSCAAGACRSRHPTL